MCGSSQCTRRAGKGGSHASRSPITKDPKVCGQSGLAGVWVTDCRVYSVKPALSLCSSCPPNDFPVEADKHDTVTRNHLFGFYPPGGNGIKLPDRFTVKTQKVPASEVRAEHLTCDFAPLNRRHRAQKAFSAETAKLPVRHPGNPQTSCWGCETRFSPCTCVYLHVRGLVTCLSNHRF